MARRLVRALGVAAALGLLPAAGAPGADCPAESEREWQRAADRLGLLIIEPERHIVGPAPGNTKTWPLANDLLGAGDNWFPLDIERKTLCGGVERWSMFEHPFSGEEHDLHAHIRPLPAFSYLLDEAAIVAGKLDHVRDCKQNCQPLIYSEVTPDALVRGGANRLVEASAVGFPKDPAKVGTFGDLACAYGPWVRESFHQNIPEVHPSEVIWGTGAGRDGAGVRHVLVVRDRSERFEKAQRFAWIPGPWWKPWTSAGDVEVRVALRAGSGTPTVTIRALPPFQPQGAPTTKDVEDGGLKVRLVDETAAFSAKLERLCTAPGDRRAFVVLRANVGEKAFLAASLKVEGGSLPPLPPVPAIVRPPAFEAVPAAPGVLERDSLRMVDGRLVGRFAYEKADGTIERRDEPIDLSVVGARAHLDPSAVRVARFEKPLPKTAELWGFNPQAPGREWSVASSLRAELALFLQMGDADRGATEIVVDELARAIDDESRRRDLFGSSRPFAVHWQDLQITDIETGVTYDQDAARKAGFDVRCFQGELGTVESCFPSRLEAVPEAEAQLARRVGVLGGLLIDSSRVAPALPPATLRIVTSGSVKGPLGEFPFEETFLNHGPGKLVDFHLTGPRSWQLDDDQLAPGLLKGLAAAVRPGNGDALTAMLRRDWAYDAADLSRRILTPAERPGALDELTDAARRKARVLLLYAQALSRAGIVSDCSNVKPCDPAAEASAQAKNAAVECVRLRDLACGYWKEAGPRP